MVRYNIYLRDYQVLFLKTLQGNVSEHIRLAINNYIKELGYNPGDIPTTSPSTSFSLIDYSKKKGGV